MSLVTAPVVDPAPGRLRRVADLVAPYTLAAVTVVVLAVVVGLVLAGLGDAARWVGSVAALAMAAWTSVGMVKDVLRGTWGVDVLAVVAIVSTVVVGEYLAAMVVVLMLTGGEALEDYAANRAGRELRSLLDRAPRVAHRITGDGAPEDVGADEVLPGDRLLVRPSEVVPVDATLLSAEADVDESSLTGESLPVTRTAGDPVLSGSVNGAFVIEVLAMRPAAESQFQRIVALVAQAQERRAPTVRLADRYAVPFTVVSLLIAGIAWWWSGDATRFAEVLVLATPCPLLIAAPTAFLAGTGRASASGIIIRGGDVVERLARVRTVAFDKTGTLTHGEASLVGVHPADTWDADEVLRLSASAEQYSSHVLAASVIEAAQSRGLGLETATEAEEHGSNGVRAALPGGQVSVGKLAHVERSAGPVSPVDLPDGELAVHVAVDGAYAGSLALRDELRDDGEETLRRLTSLGVEETLILTGDTRAAADHVARRLGIDDVRADLLPEDKVVAVQELPRRLVMMVGDGVNDAPVLAAADVGVAMGARGSTAASESADVVVMTDDLWKVAEAVSIGRRTLDVALQSIWIGIALSIGLMLVAALGHIPAIVGALTQEVVDLVAIGNALRARVPGRAGRRPGVAAAASGDTRSA